MQETIIGIRVYPGDTLRYNDKNNVIQAVRIKDHGSSILKGDYYVVTSILDADNDDGSGDLEVTAEDMLNWFEHRVEE